MFPPNGGVRAGHDAAMVGAMTDQTGVLTSLALALGASYAIAGIVVLRRLALDHMLDHMLAVLGSAEAAGERWDTRLRTLGVVLMLASGLSLLALSGWSPILYTGAGLVLGFSLLRAAWSGGSRDERAGPHGALVPFLIHAGAWAFVVLLDGRGIWRAWVDPPVIELLLILGIAAGLALVFCQPPRYRPSPLVPAAAEWTEPAPPEPPKRLIVAPSTGSGPLRDADHGNLVPVDRLGLSGALAARISDWDAIYQAGADEEDPYAPHFTDADIERAWLAEGRAITAAIAAEWNGPVEAEFSALSNFLDMAHPKRTPCERLSEDAVRRVAGWCGLPEIEEMLERLDTLAIEKDALPGWDGGSQDDVSDVQLLFTRILACMPSRYAPDIARGLESPQEQTRQWVALALRYQKEGTMP